MNPHRRTLLKAAVAAPAAVSMRAAAQRADVDLVLAAAPGEAQILDGPPTGVWQFRARVNGGPGEAVQPGRERSPPLVAGRMQKVPAGVARQLPGVAHRRRNA